MMYEYADRIIKHLNKRFLRFFSQLKTLKFDELNVISKVNSLYSDCEEITYTSFCILAEKTYRSTLKEFDLKSDEDFPADMWVDGFLDGYNPVTKYVYLSEVPRKASRCYEAIISSKVDKNSSVSKEVDKALRLWSNQVAEYADQIVLNVTRQAFMDAGVTHYIWITIPDERRCEDCKDLHGKVFPIEELPPKPHIGCRCIIKPYENN